MKELVSIVLPVYNGERYLRESIDSILSQTYKNWELLILDDCSTDMTPSICEEYCSRDNRIKYYRNDQNLKLPGNLNKGFKLSKGDFLTWTSDDNIFKSNAIEVMVSTLKNNMDVHLVYASYQDIDENGKTGPINIADLNTERIVGGNIVGACFMYSRYAYEVTGDYDVELFLVEDMDYWQRMLMKVKGKGIKDILYFYRVHSESLTSTKNNKEFGRRKEYMLRKNIKGYNELSFEGWFYYYKCLYDAKKIQNKKDFENIVLIFKIFVFRVALKVRRSLCKK